MCYNLIGNLQKLIIPDTEELCDHCFYQCSISHVTFGKSSLLKRIGKLAFSCSCLVRIHIPDSVEEICDE